MALPQRVAHYQSGAPQRPYPELGRRAFAGSPRGKSRSSQRQQPVEDGAVSGRYRCHGQGRGQGPSHHDARRGQHNAGPLMAAWQAAASKPQQQGCRHCRQQGPAQADQGWRQLGDGYPRHGQRQGKDQHAQQAVTIALQWCGRGGWRNSGRARHRGDTGKAGGLRMFLPLYANWSVQYRYTFPYQLEYWPGKTAMTVATSSDVPVGWRPVRQADATLVTQLADDVARRIDDQGLRPGTRLPSIRKMAQQAGVSRFTVVEAYGRLVARGLVQSRRGAGFFVRARRGPLAPVAGSGPAGNTGLAPPARIDVAWLLRSMFREPSALAMPGGAGLLPADWLDPDMVAAAVRAVGRSVRGQLVSYGSELGYGPLRQQLASRLQAEGVPAHPDRNLLTTNGVTHGLD